MNSNSLKARQDKPKHHCGSTFLPASREAKNRAAKRQQEVVTDGYLRSTASVKAQEKDYTGAIALLSQLINRHPDNAIDYNNRGLVYFQSGEPTLAITDYNTALKLNPQLASAYNNRANYYAAGGQLETAIADYDQAIDLNPSYVRAWLNRGITLRDLEQYEQAIENFDIALLLGQLEGHIYAERGRTYYLWGDWNYAIADYHRALSYLPQKNAATDPATRLRLQVEKELNQLLSPLAT